MEKKEAEEEERADDARAKEVFEKVRGHMKRLCDDEESVTPMKKNKAFHTSSAPSTKSRAKLVNLVKKKSVC